jgi:type I restriction enzyme R subunit
VKETGTDVAAILPPISPFAKGGVRAEKKRTVLTRLKDFFDRFFDISGGVFFEGEEKG